MNKQGDLKNGKVIGGIEWCKTVHPDGTESQGYTWNPIAGCQHDCKWLMPDGKVAVCYADTVARTFGASYKYGFKHHYWYPERLNEPSGVKEPSRIFVGSMSDVFGRWVPEDQIKSVLDACAKNPQHTFLTLTKNAPRLLKFEFPKNVHVGVSAPPSCMFGTHLSFEQQRSMVLKQLDTLEKAQATVRWMSIEPLSFDIADVFEEWQAKSGKPLPLEWFVIGAASNGKTLHQPNEEHTRRVHGVAEFGGIPVFHKGNLKWSPRMEQFPKI